MSLPPPPCPYSPKCVEGVFSEIRLQDVEKKVLLPPETKLEGGDLEVGRYKMLWYWIKMQASANRHVACGG
jgi:hypothetical protein